jgi:hypothetical protein
MVFSEIVNVYLADHKIDVPPKEVVPRNHFVKALIEVVAVRIPLLSSSHEFSCTAYPSL